ncbi:MAG: DNA primase [Actinomycetes bacterium]
MGIPADEIAQVRAATDIVGLIGEVVALKKQGRRWTGLCPFHTEKSPSFSVNGEDGLFYCFGCQKSGDAITFVRESMGLDFADSVRMLADRVGLELHEEEGGPDRKDRTQVLEAMERAVAFYHDLLLTSPDAAPARRYLRSRGYDGDVVRAFRLGWAPDDWDQLARHLNVPEKILEGAGLGFINRRGRAQDFLRARIVFPICDPGGRPIAVGGRILPPQPGQPLPDRPEPKYKNSPETSVYSKRRTLYGMNWAKKQIVEKGEIIVCEGYTDVIAFFQAGMPRAVATCGTALAEEHFQTMRNFAQRIVLAYDGDAAGQSATGRVYEWERKHEIDVAVVSLPPGTDPAELGRSDPEALAKAVAEAKPFLRFRVDRVLDLADLSTPEGRARAAQEALAAVAEHPDALVRDQYVILVADRCHLDPAMVRDRLASHVAGEVPKTKSQQRQRASAPEEIPPPPDEEAYDDGEPSWDGVSGRSGEVVDRPGLEALRLAIHRPDLAAGRLEPFLFIAPDQREAFEALLSATSLNDAIDQASARSAALLRRLAVEDLTLENPQGDDPVSAVLAQLLRASSRRALGSIQARLRQGLLDPSEGSRQVAFVQRALSELDDPGARPQAEIELVRWLSEQGEQRGD